MKNLIESINNTSQAKILRNNAILYDSEFDFELAVDFYGNNNILFIEKDVDTSNIFIEFKGSNALIYLSKNYHHYYLHCAVSDNGFIYIGRNAYMNQGDGTALDIQAYEGQNVIIGNDCLFSFDITICTSDAHRIYGYDGSRINNAMSVLVGDHVWIGQNSIVLKGTVIGSGAIVGARSVLSGKCKVRSNTICGGNPARIIKENVCFTKESVICEECDNSDKKELLSQFIYEYDETEEGLERIDQYIKQQENAGDKLKIVITHLAIPHKKNRFYV